MSKKKQHKKLVPELRFPEFKKGNEWKAEPMNKLYSFKVTNSFSRAKLNYEGGSVKNIHYGDIHTKFSTLFDITKEDVPYINTDVSIDRIKSENYCRVGDLIFADASEDLDDVGKSIEVVNLNNEKLLAGLHTLLARQIKPILEIGFAGYLFKSSGIRLQIKREAQGAKVLGISAGRLSGIEVFYPTKKEEQKKITNCLSSLDDLITAETQKLDLLKEHKVGLLQELFPDKGETVPKKRFPEFEKDRQWKETALGKISTIVRGGSPRPIADFVTTNNGALNWLKIGDVDKESKYVRSTEEKVIKAALTKTREVNPGDLIMSNSMSFGRPYILKIKTCIHDGWIAVTKIKEKINIDFLYYLILSNNSQVYFQNAAAGGGVKNLNAEIIKRLPVVLPTSIKEQQKIADCLSSIDDLIDDQTQRIDSLQAHKKGLMQQLFPNPNELDA